MRKITIRASPLFFAVLYLFCSGIGRLLRVMWLEKNWGNPTGDHLLRLIEHPKLAALYDGTFRRTATFFRLTNVFHLNSVKQFDIAVFSFYGALIVLMLLFVRWHKRISLFAVFYFCLSATLLNMYTLTFTKESYAILFYFIAYLILSNVRSATHRTGGLGITLILAGLLCRTYYLLTFVYFISILMAFPLLFGKNFSLLEKPLCRLLSPVPRVSARKTFLRVIGFFSFLAFVYFLIILTASRFVPSIYELLMYTATQEYDMASSMIAPVFQSNSVWTLSLNMFIKMFRLLIPLELLLKGSKYLPYILWQVMFTAQLFRVLHQWRSCGSMERIGFCMIVSFVATSACFEPDYGSWTRHECMLIPISFLVFDLQTASHVAVPTYKEVKFDGR